MTKNFIKIQENNDNNVNQLDEKNVFIKYQKLEREKYRGICGGEEMDQDLIRDRVTVLDESGNQKHFYVEALFEMNGESFALLRDHNETLIMKVENQDGEQYLLGLDNEIEKYNLLDAYQIAIEANPAED